MVELLSVHIPKTAGTSFRGLLQAHYGEDLVRLYPFDPDSWRHRVPDNARAVHGHFALDVLRDAYPKARTVVWLRNPIERLRSYHAYWLGVEPHGSKMHDAFMAGDRSLVSLAHLLADEVQGFLGRTTIQDFDFVGITENSEEDMTRFIRWLDARQSLFSRQARRRKRMERLGNFDLRANPSQGKAEIDSDLRAELESILGEEMKLYSEAVARRNRDIG